MTPHSPRLERASRNVDFAVALTAVVFGLRSLLGCATIPTTHRPYRAPAVLQAWLAAGLPRGRCADMELRVQLYTDQTALNRDCRAPVWGCTAFVAAGFLGWSPYTLIRAISNRPDHALDWLLAHELTHAYASCGLGDGDSWHRDMRLWGHWDERAQAWDGAFEAQAHEVLP